MMLKLIFSTTEYKLIVSNILTDLYITDISSNANNDQINVQDVINFNDVSNFNNIVK